MIQGVFAMLFKKKSKFIQIDNHIFNKYCIYCICCNRCGDGTKVLLTVIDRYGKETKLIIPMYEFMRVRRELGLDLSVYHTFFAEK